MRIRTSVSHSCAVNALVHRLGFKVVKDEGSMTELRKGGIHVVVRSRLDEDTEIRFHEDRGGRRA
ncbi:hypothetical protein KEJ25_09465 [Candidatus Bathyarchaeota archaeon]|nr:hypothetical protein [Candidatus Bathyarchaeota archaeon]